MFTLASEETYEDGQIIFKEGSSGNWVYTIISGSVEISKTVDGKKVVVELLQEGEVFGELAFLEGIKRTATVTAVGETTIGLIDRVYLDAEFNRLSSDFRAIVKAIVKRSKKLLETAYEK